METNSAAATIYNIPEAVSPAEQVQTISLWQLPKLLWAGTILFMVNAVIAVGIAASPELNVDMYGQAAGDAVLDSKKPSAFVAPEPQKPRAVRAAVKLQPVLEVAPMGALEMEMPVRSASLDIPRATATDVAPRKVSTREVRHVVLN